VQGGKDLVSANSGALASVIRLEAKLYELQTSLLKENETSAPFLAKDLM